MILTLEVIGPHSAQLGVASHKVFRSSGGVIGRDTGSDWVLPDGNVSGRHARISWDNSAFCIEDSSRNGTCLNSSHNRLPRGRPYPLKSGDRILIGPYQIQVSIADDEEDGPWNPALVPALGSADVPSPAAGPFDPDGPFGRFAGPDAGRQPSFLTSRPPAEADSGPESGLELDPLVLLGPAAVRRPAPKPPVVKVESKSPLSSHFQPPAVLRTAQPPLRPDPFIPSDYDPLAPDGTEASSLPPASAPPGLNVPASKLPLDPAPLSRRPAMPRPDAPAGVHRQQVIEAPEPVAPPMATPSDPGSVDLATVLKGAGLDGVAATPDLARSFGQILRVVVSGVMDVLRARQQIKDEFRMRVTRVRPVDNNPLKFSADVDDALHNMLVKRSAAFLEPVEAFEDAFDDLRSHQIAVLAGMRVAFESMLAQFDPDRLQESFDRQHKNSALLSMPAKLRYWELYRQRYQDTTKDAEASFRKLFGEEFAKAYEDQLRRLTAGKSEGKDRPQPPD